MAIDTREKRMSMLNFGDGTQLHTLFESDGTVDTDDRKHALDLYAEELTGGGGPSGSTRRLLLNVK